MLTIDKTDPRIHKLARAVYGRGRYKNGRLHHWTRLVKCWKTLEKFDGDYNAAFKHLLDEKYRR